MHSKLLLLSITHFDAQRSFTIIIYIIYVCATVEPPLDLYDC